MVNNGELAGIIWLTYLPTGMLFFGVITNSHGFAMLTITPPLYQCRLSLHRKVEFSSRESSKRPSEEVQLEVEKLETLPKAQEIECLGGDRNLDDEGTQ